MNYLYAYAEKKTYTNLKIHRTGTPSKSLNVYNSQLPILIENNPMSRQIVLFPKHCVNEICSEENNFHLIVMSSVLCDLYRSETLTVTLKSPHMHLELCSIGEKLPQPLAFVHFDCQFLHFHCKQNLSDSPVL